MGLLGRVSHSVAGSEGVDGATGALLGASLPTSTSSSGISSPTRSIGPYVLKSPSRNIGSKYRS